MEALMKEYKIPRFKDLRVKHLKAVTELLNFDSFVGIREKVKFNSLFTGIPEDELKQVTADANNQIFQAVVDMLSKYKPLDIKDIPKELTYNGITYTFRDKFDKRPSALWIDVSQADLEKRPELLAAFVYIEQGLMYGEMDEHKNYINSVIDRAEVFKELMPLDLYITIQGFFLQRYNEYLPLYLKVQKVREMIRNEQLPTIGKTL